VSQIIIWPWWNWVFSEIHWLCCFALTSYFCGIYLFSGMHLVL